ncbi:molybdopterin molybdenumtransferase MoeA, partial [Kitasatospora sp. NPDC096077]
MKDWSVEVKADLGIDSRSGGRVSAVAAAGVELGVLSWSRAREAARRAGLRPLPVVGLALAGAIGHVLAEPLGALTDLPAFDTSAMDGWAVAGPG